MRIDQGSVELVCQTDSGDYRFVPLDFPLPPKTEYLYGTVMRRNINATVSRPDFPTAARLVTGFWRRDIDPQPVDGVLSIDPIALSYVLGATGAVTLPTGEVVNSKNVVRLTLRDVSSRYEDAADHGDGYLKMVAAAVFEQVAKGRFDPARMLAAITQGIDNGSIMFWSANAEVQHRVESMPLGGALPGSNETQTQVGVFLRNFSLGAKIDYYLKSAVRATASCGTDGTTVYTVRVRVSSTCPLRPNRSCRNMWTATCPTRGRIPHHAVHLWPGWGESQGREPWQAL